MRLQRAPGKDMYRPSGLKTINDAFDAAWASVAPHFAAYPLLIDTARRQLAEHVLDASKDSADAEEIQQHALQAFRRSRKRRGSLPRL